VGVARAGKIEDGGIEVPPSMGMNNPMNFQFWATASPPPVTTCGSRTRSTR
jgi:hypothetical protein